MHALVASVLFASALASPVLQANRAVTPVYFALAGDSTTHSGSGWGDGFLNDTLIAPSTGHNYGHSGATTASFRTSDWSNLIKDVTAQKSKFKTYVTIQFGHNDQKATSGVTRDQYRANLLRFAQDATAAGATPILLTPLTRRNFNPNGTVVRDLAEPVADTISVATANNIDWIDLNAASMKYVEQIGQTAAWTYNLASDDHTHLNLHGSVVFGRIVSDLLVQKYPALFEAVTQKNATLTNLINAGKYA